MTFERFKSELYPVMKDMMEQFPNPLDDNYHNLLNDFLETLQTEVRMRREWLLAGFIAETGCLPSEACVCEDRSDPTRVRWHVERIPPYEAVKE